jgi:hypothetical protein
LRRQAAPCKRRAAGSVFLRIDTRRITTCKAKDVVRRSSGCTRKTL